MSSPDDPVETFVVDSGALIALERAAPTMTGLLMRVRAGQARLVVPDGVVAQVWWGGEAGAHFGTARPQTVPGARLPLARARRSALS